MNHQKVVISLGIFVFAFSVLLTIMTLGDGNITGLVIAQTIGNCEEILVKYEIEEPYDADGPYTSLELFYDDLSYEIIEAKTDVILKEGNQVAVGEVILKNVDEISGTFAVIQTFISVEKEYTKQSRKLVEPGESMTFRIEYDNYHLTDGEFNHLHSVKPGQKERWEEISKTGPHTAYRTVVKERLEEKCSIFG